MKIDSSSYRIRDDSSRVSILSSVSSYAVTSLNALSTIPKEHIKMYKSEAEILVILDSKKN